MKRIVAIFLVWIWISASEFFRNEFLFKSDWVTHYATRGQRFPDAPVNGLVWGIWALGFAFVLRALLDALPPWKVFSIGWFSGFVLMWLTIGNLQVLPYSILPFAIPLSMLEVAIALLIYTKMDSKPRSTGHLK